MVLVKKHKHLIPHKQKLVGYFLLTSAFFLIFGAEVAFSTGLFKNFTLFPVGERLL